VRRGWERSTAGVVALVVSSCAPLTDEVFAPSGLASSPAVVIDERAGVAKIPLRLAQPREQSLSLAYRLVGIDAQDDCQQPDFGAADGRVEWAAGALEAHVRVWIGDDDVAERDERFEVRLQAADDATSTTLLGHVEVVIADDDRSALLDAREFGVVPGAGGDQSAALQTALDRAAKLGRGVLVMAPGEYDVSSVSLSPGTTLSAYDVRWHRPAHSAAEVVSLRLGHEGAEPSQRGLVEGLTIDGRREEQGPYREHERQHAHLVALEGDTGQGGALRASFERLALVSGTGSGLFIGPDSEVTVCGLGATELWRDALTLNGGGTVLRVRDLDATATQGTGLWLAARAPGFGDSYRIDVEAEDLSVGAGDIEIEVSDSSQMILRRLTMTEPPFRLDARGGSVRIADSVLALGPASAPSSWAVAHDVEITRTTLAASAEAADAAKPLDFSAISLTSQSFSPGPPSSGSGQLRFSDCRFELAGKVAAGTAVYAIENADTDTSVAVTSSQLGVGFADWFAPQCRGCVRTP
jgi:hypothetical protein